MGGRGADYDSGKDIPILVNGEGEKRGKPIDAIDLPLAGRTQFGTGLTTTIEGTLTKLEKHDTINLNHERLHVLDSRGFVVSANEGTTGSVALSNRTLRTARGNVITHNHPRPDRHTHGGTFSNADLSVLAYTGAREIRASAREGVYSLKAPSQRQAKAFSDFVTSKRGQRIVQRYMRREGETAYRRYERAGTSKKSADRLRSEALNTQLRGMAKFQAEYAGRFGLTYTFTPAEGGKLKPLKSKVFRRTK